MTTTQKLQKRLNDSKAARWSALIIVSFTMMMAYFFTDVMGPLEAPLTTKGKLVYFDNGTYLSADSLMKVSTTAIASEEEIVAGNAYTIKNAGTEETVKVDSTINGLGWGSDDYGVSRKNFKHKSVILLIKNALVRKRAQI